MDENVDPITTEVVRHSLHSAAEQMKRALMRTAFSPIIYDVLDFAVAIYDREKRLLSQAPGLPNFLGTMGYCVEGAVEAVGEETLREGDVILLNYPYVTGSHQEDMAVVRPVFLGDGTAVGYTAVKAHFLDIGAKDYFCTDTVDYLQEGTVFPGVKLYRAGELQEDILRMVTANSRVPGAVAGDLNAEVAGAHTGAMSLRRIVERHGVETFDAAVEEMYDRGEAAVRRFIAGVPDGTYVGHGEMDGDGVAEGRIPMELEVVVSGDGVTVDYTQTPDARQGPVNSPLPSTVSATRVAITMLASAADPGGEGHFHEGHFRPIEVRTRPGSMFHPEPPAPAFFYYMPDYQAIEVIFNAIADALPEAVPACSGGDVTTLIWWGVYAGTGEAWADGSGNPVGQGATALDDGPSAIMHHGEAGTRITPVEVWEAKNPWIFERFQLRVDSCGPGRHRGGLGVDMFFHMLEDCWLTCGVERTENLPWGLQGGREGDANRAAIRHPDGSRVPLAKATAAKIPKGSTFELSTGGGGGYGPPSERDPEAIAADVRAGYITEDHAQTHYPQYRSGQGPPGAGRSSFSP
ncbi:MAG: hydantoinase B/oxoprolinase family protein [Solirubrobacterales bacterium]